MASPGDGVASEFYAYEGLSHYSTSADDAAAKQVFWDALGFLRRALESR